MGGRGEDQIALEIRELIKSLANYLLLMFLAKTDHN
jgi:hypothetical protein